MWKSQRLCGAGEHDVGRSDLRDKDMVVKFVGLLQPSGLSLSAVKTRRHLKYPCTGRNVSRKGDPGLRSWPRHETDEAGVNISAPDSQWCCSTLTGNQHTTLQTAAERKKG